MKAAAVPIRDLVAVGGGLLLLLALSALTTLIPPAPWKTVLSLAIAGAKAALVVWWFMRLKQHRGLVRVFAAAGLVWLSFLAVLLASDYLTR